ncbi:hypothetical protein OG2516_02703 [Oceanicola granulosus HTCC2516]|uniref:Cupin type-2 domain-containing protein n=1 Tax=Oceanicola granulosus (strain ATCC BAA-861 / DSM 15982 / KCTC 12143 / HTCC2516) TaxID=314256 RepID=Q2CCM3_OCEGH|nr:cupin domain-containing protein [Oceanicola granulosus]EAR50390.1 hypothetical protein OG2516_02703 [Oceanicola granulosus HTCC2516]
MKDVLEDAATWNGTQYKTILTNDSTSGVMSIVDSVSPAGSGPPRHVHHAEDEVFVVLTGTLEWWMEGETGTCGAGEALFVPRGREHTFRVSDDAPCRHLVILTPGGFEQFFMEMAEKGCRIPEDMAAIVESGERHNLSFTGTPL